MRGIKEIFKKQIKSEISAKKFRFIPDHAPLDFSISENIRSQFLNAYQRNPYVCGCVDLIAIASANIRPILKDIKNNELKPDHPLKMLIEQPNPKQTYTEFMHFIYSSYVLNGNAYIYVEKGRATGNILYLKPISPNDVRIILKTPIDLFDPIDHYEVGNNNMVIIPEDMIHIKSFNPLDSSRGVSPLRPISSAIEQQILIDIRNSTILKNEGKPRFKYKIPPENAMSEEEYEDIKDTLRGVWGPNKAGSWLILDNGNDAEEIFTQAVDIDYYVGSKVSMRQICACLHVPPEMMGDGENKTYANSSEARRGFAQDCVLPKVQLVFDALHKSLISRYEDVGVITYDTEDIKDLKGDEIEKFTAINSLTFLTPNEKRDMMGWDKLPDGLGDLPILVGGMITLKAVEEGISSTPSGQQARESAQNNENPDEKNSDDPQEDNSEDNNPNEKADENTNDQSDNSGENTKNKEKSSKRT